MEGCMEAVTSTHIYWFISIGIMIGFILGLIIGDEGMRLGPNIFWGAVGSVMMGLIGIWMGLGDGIWFAFLALWPFLFLINVFHQHHEEDILGEIEHPAKVLPK
jgi:hypothetical protein